MAAALPHDTVLDGEVICWAETDRNPDRSAICSADSAARLWAENCAMTAQ